MSKTDPSRYERYVDETIEDIKQIIDTFGCQPILFVGSGLAKRYMSAPSWEELLGHLAAQCSTIEHGLGYYKQALKTPMRIGEEFASLYQTWAWGAGHNEFRKDMFSDNIDAQSYIKFKISEYLTSLTPSSVDGLNVEAHGEEITSLAKIRPHAIITTNYDCMLELLFPDHQPIVGQQILKGQQFSVGEIFKIHGCVTECSSLVFTQSDYDIFYEEEEVFGC